MAEYGCVFRHGNLVENAAAAIGEDAVTISGEKSFRILYADIDDLRLLNYHLILDLGDSRAEISSLGYETENFFEKLWEAYAAKSIDSLFVEGSPVMESEGDYIICEPGVDRKSIARLEAFPDCLCIVPHDHAARRVPYCFAGEPKREGFALDLELDTKESYRIARLGKDTEDFFRIVSQCREKTKKTWDEAHARLERSLGDADPAYRVFSSLCGKPVCGLFSPDETFCWIAAVKDGKAAVELFTDEKTATYLYRFDADEEEFILRLRHAMEAVKMNRRLIYLAEEELVKEPLYRMAVDRSAHVRFLRACSAGRIIHTEHWEKKLREFF